MKIRFKMIYKCKDEIKTTFLYIQPNFLIPETSLRGWPHKGEQNPKMNL